MSLTPLQRDLCQLLAVQRKKSGESYVAGGVALNDATGSARRSRDIDLFHDTAAALQASWTTDRATLQEAGFTISALRERQTFVEATVQRGSETVLVEWSQDSAFRYFPLQEHALLGLTLHPLDLATNKLLALAGRREVRDFVDVVAADGTIQPLGFLAWAASGKDPGLSPAAVLEQAARSVRYTQVEIDALDFDGPRPDAAALSESWHALLDEAREVVSLMPAQHAGTCALDADLRLTRATSKQLRDGQLNLLVFHPGCIRGAWPRIIG